LLSCYNDPLGRYLQSVSSQYPTLTVGPFLRTVSTLPGIPALSEPEKLEDRDHFWNFEMINHLNRFAEQSIVKFDTIVLDERQDFNDEWMEIVEKILVSENSKILCVADPNQDLYDRGFFMPEGGSPWALAELGINCRNTREIANFVRRLGGGVAASASPEGDPIKFISAINEESLVQTVLSVIDDYSAMQGFKTSDIVIITGTAAERNLFYNLQSSKYVFSKWEDRTNSTIACETAKRAKGIEAEHVIVATLNEEIRRNEMYVAASRARSRLVIVGPNRLDERFKVSTEKL
jgi:superfamily I DNA/RNA helicase